MKVSARSLQIVVPILLALGCGDDDKSTGSNTGNATGSADASVSFDGSVYVLDGSISLPGPGSGVQVDAGLTTLTDNQIVGITATVNQGEIAQGMLAKTKAQDKAVAAYADAMVQMHTQAASAEATLVGTLGLTPAPTTESTKLKNEADAALTLLQGIPEGADFDLTYLEGQAEQHQVVLDLLDQKLLPDATAPALKASLQATRSMVQMHLDQAKAILNPIARDAGITLRDGG